MIKQFYQATYWVGCDAESAHEIMFDIATVESRREEFEYIAAFNLSGKKIDEAKIEFYEENGEPYFNFAF